MFYSYPRNEQPKIFPSISNLIIVFTPIHKLLQQSLLLSLDIHQQKKLGRPVLVLQKERKKKKRKYLAQVFFKVFKVQERSIPSRSNQIKIIFSLCSPSS